MMNYQVLGCANLLERAKFDQLLLAWAVSVLALQSVFHGCIAVLAPGYMLPLMAHPVGRIALAVAFGWEVFGWIILYFLRPRSKVQFGCAVAFVIVFFATPLGVLPMLGPSTTSIMQATGPVEDQPIQSQSRKDAK